MSRLAMYAPDEYTVPNYSGPSIELIREQQRDAEAENPTCDTCYEPLAGMDKEGDGETCWECLHEECEDHPCEDCHSAAIDKAMDAMER